MSDIRSQSQPEPETPEFEQFQTYSRREIINVLEDIIARNALVTVHFNQGEDSFVTNLLHVNPEFEELVFDAAPDQAMATRLAQSRRISYVTFIDQIKIQFHTELVESTSFDGRPALRTRLPDSLLRLQRRNFYRVPAPAKSTPLMCEIPLPGAAPVRFAIGDISVGGVGMIAGPALAEFSSGTIFHDCTIELPGHGSFTTSLEIRNNKGLSPGSGNPERFRYGCQFLNLSGPVVSLIQRYINQLERTRRPLV